MYFSISLSAELTKKNKIWSFLLRNESFDEKVNNCKIKA